MCGVIKVEIDLNSHFDLLEIVNNEIFKDKEFTLSTSECEKLVKLFNKIHIERYARDMYPNHEYFACDDDELKEELDEYEYEGRTLIEDFYSIFNALEEAIANNKSVFIC